MNLNLREHDGWRRLVAWTAGIVIMLGAACGDDDVADVVPSPTRPTSDALTRVAVITPLSTPGQLDPQLLKAVLQARVDLANRQGLRQEQLSLESATPVDWSDSCLDYPVGEETCSEVVTPGFQIVLISSDRRFTYRTNRAATEVRLVRQEPL
jgi:hypothetical protein